MSGKDGDASPCALRLVEDAELSQHRRPVVIDFFSRQAVVGIEAVHATEREFDTPSGGRKAPPRAQVRSANDHLQKDGIAGNVPALYVNPQVGQSPHELLIKPAHSIGSAIVFVPGLVVVLRGFAKGPEHAFQVMLVLQSDMFFNDGDAGRLPMCGNRSAGQIRPRLR